MTTDTIQPIELSNDAVALPPQPPGPLPSAGVSGLSATYSPEDNKLRLYTVRRLDADLYARVRAAGFIWAPKQELFVAPMWTPARADLLVELCGEIGDEDTSLVDRAEERADRFEDYSGKRADDARRAREGVAAISQRFEFGQPILVGHHSERRARKDAERMENGMRQAVQMWETSEYWQRRAAGAISHAKYKERPDVRARRIKGIEADKRKTERGQAETVELLNKYTQEGALELKLSDGRGVVRAMLEAWGGGLGMEAREKLQRGEMELADALQIAVKGLRALERHQGRWIAHYENRLTYERAMLAEQGGLAADKFDIQPGGHVKIGGEWLAVVRVTKRAGKLASVTTDARFVPVRSAEEVQDYRAPTAETAAKVQAAAKLPPLCNYPGEGFHHMTQAEWKKTHTDYKGSRELGKGAVRPGGYRPDIKAGLDSAEKFARHRVRSVVHRGCLVAVYLTDAKRKDPDAAEAVQAPEPVKLTPPVDQVAEETPRRAAPVKSEEAQQFDQLAEQLRRGVAVQVVHAPQFFPTPAGLAQQMADLLRVREGERVLEPSAGTGRLIQPLRQEDAQQEVVAVEINEMMCHDLRRKFCSEEAAQKVRVIPGDFLAMGVRELGLFDAVIANPPFGGAADIKHIKHAISLLRAGGRMVALCANGPRQAEQLRPMVEAYGGIWEEQPRGTFSESGTEVSSVLIYFELPEID